MTTLVRAMLLAYLLPSGVLLHQMAVRRSELLPERYEVSGTVTLVGDEARRAAAGLGMQPQDPLAIPAKLSFSSGKCIVQVNGGQKVVATNLGGQVTVDPAASAQSADFAGWIARLGCFPFLFRGEGAASAFEGFLRKAGGDLDDVALSLEGGEVAYVLGGGEEGSGKVGLVIQKRGMVPQRVWETEGTTRVEVVFKEYRSVFHEGGFPTVLELRSGGQPVARFVAAQ
jgi:hypothetical protein